MENNEEEIVNNVVNIESYHEFGSSVSNTQKSVESEVAVASNAKVTDKMNVIENIDDSEDVGLPHGKKFTKRIIMDSDSENEDSNVEDNINEVEDVSELSQLNNRQLFDSDVESIELSIKRSQDNEMVTKQKKTFKLIDSDSEPETEVQTQYVEHKLNNLGEEITKEEPIYAFNDKQQLVPEKNIADGLAALCDPESSDEEEKQIKPLAYKKKPKKKDEEPEEKRMTAKEAAEQRKEIESTSQRMLRERHVSLPYHKPKQRSLKEFLQNRPKFTSAVPASLKRVPAAVAIKMSREQLDIVSKRMQEREKQVKEFYKSESEEEDALQNDENNMSESENKEKNNITQEISEEKVDNENELKTVENVDEIKDKVHENSVVLETVECLDNMCNSNKKEVLDVVEQNISTIESHTLKEPEVIEPMEVEESNESLNKTNESLTKSLVKSTELKFNISDLDDEETIETNTNQTNSINIIQNILIPVTKESELKSEVPIKKSAFQLLKEQLGDTKPKLSGAPNYVIDLEEGTTHLDEVTMLMQRFTKHTAKKPLHKKPSAVELDVMCVSQGGDIHKEKVAVKVDEHEEPPIEEKPGVKYQKLKNDLQTQMAAKRNELWKEKQARMQAEKEENDEIDAVYKGEKDSCGIDDILDDEEEEFSDSGSDESESDKDVEDEEGEKDVNNEAGGLIDNEALDDDEEEEDLDENNEGGDEVENDCEEDEDEAEIIKKKRKPKKIKQLRRIIQPDSDSDSDNCDNDSKDNITNTRSNETKEGNTDKYLDSTISWPDDDDWISAGQTNSCRTPKKQSCMLTKSELGFISPICRLTGLQSFDATGKFLQNSPGSPALKLGEPSPFKSNANIGGSFSKSLFVDSPLKNTQTVEELEGLCSGTFPTTQSDLKLNNKQLNSVENSDNIDENVVPTQQEPDTQEMLELCSGNFGFTQDTTQKSVENGLGTNEVVKTNETCEHDAEKRNIESTFVEPIKMQLKNEKASEVQIDEDEDRLISQLIDEDELATFRKKFESPLQSTYTAPDADERIAKKIAFDAMNQIENENISSDDDDDDNQINLSTLNRKRKTNKIMDSDEEDFGNYDENIELIDKDDDDGDENEEDNDNKLNNTELGYDSEENEILVEITDKPKKLKMKDFVDNEAELSESEWGSEDEDERDLNVMEAEEADKEYYDENKLRTDLERIHMRRVLDEDKQEMKVLQELYLDEDEELKGAGRQRQFRWRNIDNDNNDGTPQDVDTSIVHDDEAENEEEWRKKRYERELFLQSQKQNVGADDDDDTSLPGMAASSQLFKLGQRAVIKNKRTLKKTTEHVNNQPSLVLNAQRGSFLSRKDEVLSRVAEYTKVSEVNKAGVQKNSRNFVFQSVAKSTEENPGASTSTSFQDKKRKAGEAAGTPAQLKRLRLNGFSPADQKKKADSRSKARLFVNKSSNQW